MLQSHMRAPFTAWQSSGRTHMPVVASCRHPAPHPSRVSSGAGPSNTSRQHEQHPHQNQAQQERQEAQQAVQGRRHVLSAGAAAAIAIVAAGVAPLPARADAVQEAASGFVEWWKSRQRQNGGIKLLAPLRSAQQRLTVASRMLDSATASSPVAATAAATDDSLKTLLQTVRASSLNCYAFEPMADDSLETRASLLTARWELRDPCTFRIILRSVTDLSKPEVQEAAVAKMDNLVLSYQKLDAYLEMAREGNPDALPKAAQEIRTTMAVAADIEKFVMGVLQV